MKWAILILFVLLFCQGLFSARTDVQLIAQQTRTEAYIAQQFAYSDSLIKYSDGDPGLAWAKVARNARANQAVITSWLQHPPWREAQVANTQTANAAIRYCMFLDAKIDSVLDAKESP